ncbi:MAG: metal-dependent hydrolase [Opitutus sp.]|nr:metal-dependent hydrolase [Opitutus sp.]
MSPFMNRREFMARAGATGAALAIGRTSVQAAAAPGPAGSPAAIIDANVSLFRWPFRRLPLDEPAALLKKMAEFGVGTAWAGSFEALLHRDIAGVNARLAGECARSGGRLVPFGTVNLSLPDWEEDLRRCHEVHRMPGIRIFPNYHGYTLADAAAARLLRGAAERKMVVQLAVAMEDVRTQHPLVRVSDVDLRPLSDALEQAGNPRVMLLNAGRAVPAATLKTLAARGVRFDISRVEGVGGVGAFLRSVPAGRVLFGTHAPFFSYEAGLIKVHESELAADEAARLLGGNAREFLRAG